MWHQLLVMLSGADGRQVGRGQFGNCKGTASKCCADLPDKYGRWCIRGQLSSDHTRVPRARSIRATGGSQWGKGAQVASTWVDTDTPTKSARERTGDDDHEHGNVGARREHMEEEQQQQQQPSRGRDGEPQDSVPRAWEPRKARHSLTDWLATGCDADADARVGILIHQ